MACIGGVSFGKVLMISMTPCGQIASGGQARLQFGQFLAIGQMIVVEQKNNFFVGNFSGQFVDVVAAIDQFADIAFDITEPRIRSNDTFQTFCGSNLGSHSKNR